jgi:AraC-like DNA-binding protein
MADRSSGLTWEGALGGGEVVSDVLRAVRLRGAIFFEIEGQGAWVAEAPPTAEFADAVMPGSSHVIEYHVLIEGACWAARIVGDELEPPVRMGPGSIIVFPQGDPHVISTGPCRRVEPVRDYYRQPVGGERLPYAIRVEGEEGAEPTKMICGFLGCDARPFNPLLASLPPMIHVAGGATGWLGSLIQATLAESRERRLGGDSVLTRLSELIFIEVIRRHAEGLSVDGRGWLAALNEPIVGRALKILHAEPGRGWSLAELARVVGASRTVLAERFATAVGLPPMTYLQNWRMQLAEGLLAEGRTPMAEVAARVGYESEEAFSRAFKRTRGVPPGARRRALTPSA